MFTFETVQQHLRAPAHFTQEQQVNRALVYFCVFMIALQRVREKFPSLLPLIEAWVKVYSKNNVLQLFGMQLTNKERMHQQRAIQMFQQKPADPAVVNDAQKLNAIMQFVAEYNARNQG
jgi:hypothetical protein